nr:MAG TPA: conjugal transfer protein [Caudoviricetes sp.]
MEPIEIASLGLGIVSIILGALTAIQNIRNSLGEQEPWKQRGREMFREPPCKGHRTPEGHVPSEEERAMIRAGQYTGGESRC